MLLRRALLLSSLFLTALGSPVDWDSFNRLLDNVDDSSIHSVLHFLSPKFQDGVFSKDRTAIEQVHAEDPPLASRLIELAKRQTNNVTTTTATTTSDPPTTTAGTTTIFDTSTTQTSTSDASSSTVTVVTSDSSTSTVSSSQQATVVVSPSTPAETSALSSQQAASSATAESSSQAASLSSVESSQIHASTAPAPTVQTVAPAAPSGAVPVATSAGNVVFSSVNGGGLTTIASSTRLVSFSRSSSTVLETYTLPNGQLTTSTSIFVVNAPVTETGGALSSAAAASATDTGSPSLQSSPAEVARPLDFKDIALVVGGAAAVALIL